MQTAVVGHVEWVEFVRVPRVPRSGEIVHAEAIWEGPGGGGAGAAVQLSKLSAGTSLFTALGGDDLGKRAEHDLEKRGLTLHVAQRKEGTRRAFTHVEPSGERTITVVGERLGPRSADPLPWEELKHADATFFTAGDEAALRLARTSRILVATSRALDVVRAAGVQLDALVGSLSDPDESYVPGSLDPPPLLVVMTEGSSGGRYWSSDGTERRFTAPDLMGPIVDRYGAGDSFAGGLTFALGAAFSDHDAVAFAARCGTASLRGNGPFEGQLTAPEATPPGSHTTDAPW